MGYFVPGRGRLFVELDKRESMTKGGIALPESAQDTDYAWGTVVAVGPDRITETGFSLPSQARLKERVLFPRGNATEFKHQGLSVFMITEHDILARTGE